MSWFKIGLGVYLIAFGACFIVYALSAKKHDKKHEDYGDSRPDTWEFKLARGLFIVIGGIVCIIGLTMITNTIKRYEIRKALIDNGEYVIAEINGIFETGRYEEDDDPTYVLECSYLDIETGKVYIFTSATMARDMSKYLEQDTVKVYVDRDSDFHKYYVDIDSLFEHVK